MSESGKKPTPSLQSGHVVVIVVLSLGSMIAMFNTTMVNVMVPAIGAEFHMPVLGLEWVSTSYTLAYGSLLLLGGA